MYAEKYVLTYMFGIYIHKLADQEKKLINNVGKNRISLYITIFDMIFRVSSTYILVVKYDLNIVGTGLANLLTSTLVFFIIHTYCILDPELSDAVKFPDKSVFNIEGIKEYIYIAFPSTVMLCLDWWVWEIMVLISGYFGVTQQATQIVMVHIVNFMYMAAIGFEQASCTIIGYHIGKDDVKGAKQFYSHF